MTLTIHGCGGHGRVVLAAALARSWAVRMTDDTKGTRPDKNAQCHIAIGDNATRKKFAGYKLETIIHPSAIVDRDATIQPGAFIGARVVIQPGAVVGTGAIINTGAIVEHDCRVGDWVHLAPGAVLCGNVSVGEGSFIGANAVVREGVTIAAWSVIGCGSAVVEDVLTGVYGGVPARKIRG